MKAPAEHLTNFFGLFQSAADFISPAVSPRDTTPSARRQSIQDARVILAITRSTIQPGYTLLDAALSTSRSTTASLARFPNDIKPMMYGYVAISEAAKILGAYAVAKTILSSPRTHEFVRATAETLDKFF